jgi:hypothetical protein
MRFASAAGFATFVLASGIAFGLLTSWPLPPLRGSGDSG